MPRKYYWYCEGFEFFFNIAAELEAHVAKLKTQRNISGLRYKIRRTLETNPTIFVKEGVIS